MKKTLGKIPLIGRLFKSCPKVAILRLSGVIASGGGGLSKQSLNLNSLEILIKEAFETSGVKAIALNVNSPGGSPVQSALIADRICALSKEKDIPVYSFVEDVAASGGYWLACAGSEIYAYNSSIIGSIGVVSTGFGLEKIAKKHGVERRIYTSGKNKSFLDPFLPENQDDIDRLKSLQKEIHEDFISWVKKQRDGKLQEDKTDLFQGDFWTGSRAKEYGLIDDIGECRQIMTKKLGEDVKFIDITPSRGIKGMLFSFFKPKNNISLTDNHSDIIAKCFQEFDKYLHWSRYGL